MSAAAQEQQARLLPNDQDASGRTLGDAEIANLVRAIHSGTLTATKGTFVKRFQAEFAEILNVKHAFACASGSAAVHAAVAAINPEPGDEIVTTPITDMGALSPILYQGAIPVFADVDPATLNVNASSIAKVLSNRTRAIVVTHLFGMPAADMDDILELARQRGIPIIEDCAQAFQASSNGRLAGTMGSIGCFSLQQGKHITTGEGGIVVTSDDQLARRVSLFINKGWPYGEAHPDHEFLALNYRMSELQGAVACAQLPKLRSAVELRRLLAAMLSSGLAGIPGLKTPPVHPRSAGAYWKYPLHIDREVYPRGPHGFAADLRELRLTTAPRYIEKPAFECRVFREQRTFGNSRWPFTLARAEAVDYARDLFPGTYAGLDSILVLPWNDRYTVQDLEYIGASIETTAQKMLAHG